MKVVAIEPYGSKDRARIVVTLSGPATYRVGEICRPSPVRPNLERTEPSPHHEVVVGGLVERVRQSARSGDATRIVPRSQRQGLTARIFYFARAVSGS